MLPVSQYTGVTACYICMHACICIFNSVYASKHECANCSRVFVLMCAQLFTQAHAYEPVYQLAFVCVKTRTAMKEKKSENQR